MVIPAISAAAAYSPQAVPTIGQHKHGKHPQSISDVDGQGSSIATAPSSSGKIGSKIDISA